MDLNPYTGMGMGMGMNMGMNMGMSLDDMLGDEPRSPMDLDIVREALLVDFKRRWSAWNKIMTELVMKRFQGKIDPAWHAFLQELLMSRPAPTAPDNDLDETRLKKWLTFQVLYPTKDPKAPSGQGVPRTFTISQMLEAVYGGGNDKEALQKAPARITDLLAMRDSADVRKMLKRDGVLAQFLKMATRGGSLPAFIKSAKANPLKNATGQWMWAVK